MEKIDILDMELNIIGCEERTVVHREGLVHQTFHCWLFQKEMDKRYIIFQKRHSKKDIFPSYFDVTAAGHLSSGEVPEDGIRELEEELGVTVDFERLKAIGVSFEEKYDAGLIDREFHHVYMLETENELKSFNIQKDELEGIGRVELGQFDNLINDQSKNVQMEYCCWNSENKAEIIKVNVDFQQFVPHSKEYYSSIIDAIKAM